MKFQSLKGFSVGCDVRSPHGRSTMRQGFQSLKGFSVGCDQALRDRVAATALFQSLKGFSVGCDSVMFLVDVLVRMFQSLKGFSVGCDIEAIPGAVSLVTVSIPERV